MSRAFLNVYFGAGQDAFINWIKSGQGFGPGGDSINTLNQYGCPTVPISALDLSFNTWRMQLDIPATSTYSGHWVLKFKGTGGFKITSDGGTLTNIASSGTVTGSGTNALSLSGTDPRVEFSVSSTGGVGWFGQFLGGAITYSNMKGPALVRLDQETAYDNGEFFNPDFISQLNTLHPLGLRLLQYSNTSSNDQNNALPFTHMPDLDYLTWGTGSDSWPISCYVGTIGGTDTYTCSAAPDTPVSITPGETVWGVVTNANTLTTSTLNINGRGAKKLLHHDAAAIQVGEVVAGGLGTFVYDPNSDGYMYSNAAIQTGMPINVQVALCNRIGCDAWYTVNANMPDSEITAIVQYFRDNLIGKLWLEWGNEIWGGVPQPAAIVQAWSAGEGGVGTAQVYGYNIRRTMGLATTAWSPRSLTQLRRVAAWQAFGAVADFNTFCLQATGYAKMTGLGWDVAPNRPIDFIDALAFATYYQGPSVPAFQGGYTGNTSGVQAGLYTAADNYDSSNPTQMAAALDWLDNDVRQGTGGNSDFQTLLSLSNGPIVVNGQAGAYKGWEALAASYDASRPTNKIQIVNYEGGLQINPPDITTVTGLGVNPAYITKITNLFNAYKFDARFKKLAFDQLTQFMVGAHSFAPSWYAFCGTVNQWSTHSGDLYSTKFKSFDALAQFNGIVTPGPKNIRDNF